MSILLNTSTYKSITWQKGFVLKNCLQLISLNSSYLVINCYFQLGNWYKMVYFGLLFLWGFLKCLINSLLTE